MKKHGVQITYGNIHSKEIKHSLKIEKRTRKQEESYPIHVSNMLEDFVKKTPPLLLDPEHPIPSIEFEKASLSSIDNEKDETKSKSTLHKIKNKIKISFKKKHKKSDDDDEQISTNSDASSNTNPVDAFQKPN